MQDSALGKNLRRQRLAAGKTQQDLATEAGVGLRTVQEVEKGKGTTVSTVYALASALGIPAGELLDPSPTEPEAAAS